MRRLSLTAKWRDRLFASRAEVRFIRVMGGHVLTLPFWREPENHSCAIVVGSLGQTLKSERVQRRVRVGAELVEFGNDIGRAVKLDGRRYHHDIVYQQEQDDYFAERGWQVLHVDPGRLWIEPERVQREAARFLTH